MSLAKLEGLGQEACLLGIQTRALELFLLLLLQLSLLPPDPSKLAHTLVLIAGSSGVSGSSISFINVSLTPRESLGWHRRVVLMD